ncbi:MAG: hypothetical protein J6X29_04650 [Clostridia bacterium]|nr:hypothetical protein [Clostridia bacterium]
MENNIRLCDECGIRPATRYTKVMINGVSKSLALCADCSAKLGFSNPFSQLESMMSPLSEMFGVFPGIANPSTSLKCPTCGYDIQQYYSTGYLGCPDCYKAFSSALDSSIKKIQKDTRHTGKMPKKSLSPQEKEYSELLKAREEAVKREDFVTAAEINEKMKKLKGGA